MPPAGPPAPAAKQDQEAGQDALAAISWEESVVEGPVGKEAGTGDSEGQRSMFVGGTMTVHANMTALTPEQKALVTDKVDAGGEEHQAAGGWKSNTSYEWKSQFLIAGRFNIDYSLTAGGATETNTVPVLIKADAATARANIAIAQSVLGAKRMNLGPAHTAYKAAYEKHKSTLADAGAAEKLEKDVLVKIAPTSPGRPTRRTNNFVANLEGINKAVALGERAFEGNPATVMKADKTLDQLADGLHGNEARYLRDMSRSGSSATRTSTSSPRRRTPPRPASWSG